MVDGILMMDEKALKYCPGTLAGGHETYSRTALRAIFDGKKVSHILPYDSPASNELTDQLYDDNKKRISISGVQEKFSVVLDKNRIRLTNQGEQGHYILKPIPSYGKNADQMPANEHLTMQIARQVFGLETAMNALIFFRDGSPAYITKRFDVNPDGSKKAQEDFASLAGRTPQTHGENYKYQGNCLDLFSLLKRFVPAYRVEAPKLFKIILFNFLFSNGDAHYKNFSLIETSIGDFRLSPAYDLLNTRIHIGDKDFALDEGLLPPTYAQGKVKDQFYRLAEMAEISKIQADKSISLLTSASEKVKHLITCSFLSGKMKRNYEQAYLTRLHKLR